MTTISLHNTMLWKQGKTYTVKNNRGLFTLHQNETVFWLSDSNSDCRACAEGPLWQNRTKKKTEHSAEILKKHIETLWHKCLFQIDNKLVTKWQQSESRGVKAPEVWSLSVQMWQSVCYQGRLTLLSQSAGITENCWVKLEHLTQITQLKGQFYKIMWKCCKHKGWYGPKEAVL